VLFSGKVDGMPSVQSMTAELAGATGLAFGKSIAKMPELNLYVPDLRHPSVAGSYLAACVTYATLFKASPVDLKYTAGLDPAIAKHLQTVAWETVQEYFKL
jgi:hypothetical protein